jgi:hypothetical protein
MRATNAIASLHPGYEIRERNDMSTYVWRNGCWREKRTSAPLALPQRAAVCSPRVQRDIADYRSPIDGRPITTRSERREDLKRHGCVEVDPPQRPRGFRNADFAVKRGLRLREES